MSKCHFPHDNHTIILDFPSISRITNTLLLIQTNKDILENSLLSLTCLDQQGGNASTANNLNYSLMDSAYDMYEDCEDSLGINMQNQQN